MTDSLSPKGESEMKKWYRKLSLPLAVVFTLAFIAGSWALARAADTAADGQRLNPPGKNSSGQITTPSSHAPVPVLVGGMSSADTVSHVLRTTSGGYAQNYQMNRQSDDNTIVNLYTGSLTPIGGSATTSFYDMSIFSSATLHLSWTDSTSTAAALDSTAFEIIPFGKMSMTNDGWNFYLDIAPTDTSSALSSWFVSSPRNPWWVSTVKRYAAYVPIIRLPNQNGIGGLGPVAISTYSVSIPVATLQGLWFKENIIGFTVINRATAAGGLGILHNLSVDLVLKAN